MPAASTQSFPTERTSLKPRTSRRLPACPARSRNRFELAFARPPGPLPCLSRAASASFFRVCGWRFVEESTAHRVSGGVPLGKHDLEQMRIPGARAEHLGAAVEIDAPDAAAACVA